jgi:hypothetical protein
VTNPDDETISKSHKILQISNGFCIPIGQFYHTLTNPAHLSGLSHLDNFIVTRKSCLSIGIVQKLMPTPTQTATPLAIKPL